MRAPQNDASRTDMFRAQDFLVRQQNVLDGSGHGSPHARSYTSQQAGNCRGSTGGCSAKAQYQGQQAAADAGKPCPATPGARRRQGQVPHANFRHA